MMYQLPNGKTIEISTEQFLDMTDEDFEYLIAHDAGEQFQNPFSNSVLYDGEIGPKIKKEIVPRIRLDDIDEEQLDKDIDLGYIEDSEEY